jgi:hypothetical protein
VEARSILSFQKSSPFKEKRAEPRGAAKTKFPHPSVFLLGTFFGWTTVWMAGMSPVAGVGSPQPFLTDTDYENMPIHWNDCEDYEIIRKVGRGKYSEVFEGWKVSSEEKVIIKCLKPVRSSFNFVLSFE